MFIRIVVSCLIALVFTFTGEANAQSTYVPPDSPRVTFDFNPDWKFIRQDVNGAEAVEFDDSRWDNVSTPHSYNETDSFRVIISHGAGDRGTYKGIGWYRKHFKIPASYTGRKVFIEFEGMRQAGDIFLNGKAVGLYENGITAYGLDISKAVHFGADENVLAVKVDNSLTYPERATGVPFEWNVNDFNPDHGGINRRVWLHITGDIYQTLPVYYGLRTTGTYIYPGNFNIPGHSCDVNVESQVQNSSNDRAMVAMSVVVVDGEGEIKAKFDGDAVNIVAGESAVIRAGGHLKDARFWSVEDPYLYRVYTILSVDGKVVDSARKITGFRKAEFKGGAGSGGLYINDKFVYLKGYAQRTCNEWAGLGQGYPDWMHDFTAALLRQSNGNYVRWMHVSPQPVDVEAFDRAGIVEICPAGDKEKDPVGRQWEQRLEVMRDSLIYYRDNPSILFWEAGSTVVTAEHMRQMVDLRKQWDPNGGRAMGVRDNDLAAANTAITPIAEYYGIEIGQDRRTDALIRPTDIFRGYSGERRDRAPLIENEDYREEAARRYWDDFSPPYFGFKKGALDTYNLNSETMALGQATRYWAYLSNCISNPNAAHSKWSGYASIYFSDSDADGRQDSSEVCRVSGKMDAVRLPKEIYFVERVMQNEKPDIHIIGHWSYPAATTKTMYVAANHVDSVELFINGESKGKVDQPTDGYIYAFPDIHFAPGTIRAVGYRDGQSVAEHELKTAGQAMTIKLTPYIGPGGLKADGEDVALFDVEVVDANGQRCPTDDARIDFTVEGPAIWRGGYNSGKINSTNNLYLNTECGINRVAIRATRTAGTIKLTATREGLTPARVEVISSEVGVRDGLAPVK